MASRIASARRIYKFNKGSIIDNEASHLPSSYKKFYEEWKLNRPQPVHYIPPQTEWQRNEETGEIKRIQDVPIPVLFPPESHEGIWGGEGVVKGFQKRNKTKQRVPHFWVPHLIQTAVYSEILNKRLSVTATNRTIDLILENHGFDHYILKNKACDLQSGLALKIKRRMLLALYNKDLYPEDPIKAKAVYNKYKHYLEGYTEEDIDWYGLTVDEALRKWEAESQVEPIPLKIQFRKEFLASLASPQQEPEVAEDSDDSKRSWLDKINPFAKN